MLLWWAKINLNYQKLKEKSAKEICIGILEDVIKFSKNGSYTDDKTIVVIKRNPESNF